MMRMTLSIPADLYERMLEDLADANWSAIAAAAFRIALAGDRTPEVREEIRQMRQRLDELEKKLPT